MTSVARQPQDYIVDTGGIRLHARIHDGGGPTLLCLHGLGSNARWWDLVGPRMHPVCRTVAVDLRGHGTSDAPPAGYTLDQLAVDICHLVDELAVPRLVLAGHSFGAAVAIRVAAERPGIVAALALIDGGIVDIRSVAGETWEEARGVLAPPPPPLPITVDVLRAWLAASPLSQRCGVETALDMLLASFDDRGDHLAARPPHRHRLALARSLWEQPRAPLDRLECPLTAILGTRGSERQVAARRRAADDLRDRGDKTEVVWVDGDHELPIEAPDDVAASLRQLVASSNRANR